MTNWIINQEVDSKFSINVRFKLYNTESRAPDISCHYKCNTITMLYNEARTNPIQR